MRFSVLAFATCALAARPFLDEPDTGIDEQLGAFVANKTLPPLEALVGLPDFQWVGRNFMGTRNFTYYRNGAAGEWSYRNNLEIFSRYRLRPRVFKDILNVGASLPTTILGYNFSAPFFISPCARADYANSEAEIGLVRGAGDANILYMPSLFSSNTMEEIYEARPNGTQQVLFQQVYLTENMTETKELFKRIEKVGSKAIVLTVDSAGDGVRHRAKRYSVGSADSSLSLLTWDLYRELSNMTSLPIIPKGIQTVEDAREAVKNGAKAIFLSNHGGRQTDTSPSSLQVALEIHQEDPSIFKEIEVYADGGVRYGTDILKLLALGVRAVGVGRPFMFANVYGHKGVKKAADILKYELLNDAANVGLGDIKKITPDVVSWKSSSPWVGNSEL